LASVWTGRSGGELGLSDDSLAVSATHPHLGQTALEDGLRQRLQQSADDFGLTDRRDDPRDIAGAPVLGNSTLAALLAMRS